MAYLFFDGNLATNYTIDTSIDANLIKNDITTTCSIDALITPVFDRLTNFHIVSTDINYEIIWYK